MTRPGRTEPALFLNRMAIPWSALVDPSVVVSGVGPIDARGQVLVTATVSGSALMSVLLSPPANVP